MWKSTCSDAFAWRVALLVAVIFVLCDVAVCGNKGQSIVISTGGKKEKEYVPYPVPVPVPVHVPVHVPHKKDHEEHGNEGGDEGDGEDSRVNSVLKTPPPAFYAHLANLNALTSNMPPFILPGASSSFSPYGHHQGYGHSTSQSSAAGPKDHNKNSFGGEPLPSSANSAHLKAPASANQDSSYKGSQFPQRGFSSEYSFGANPYSAQFFGGADRFQPQQPANRGHLMHGGARFGGGSHLTRNPFGLASASYDLPLRIADHLMNDIPYGAGIGAGHLPASFFREARLRAQIEQQFADAPPHPRRPSNANAAVQYGDHRSHHDHGHNDDKHHDDGDYARGANHLSHMKHSTHIDAAMKKDEKKANVHVWDTRIPKYDTSDVFDSKYSNKEADDYSNEKNSKGASSAATDKAEGDDLSAGNIKSYEMIHSSTEPKEDQVKSAGRTISHSTSPNPTPAPADSSTTSGNKGQASSLARRQTAKFGNRDSSSSQVSAGYPSYS